MKQFFIFCLSLFIGSQILLAQETFSVNGPHNKIHNYYAFIHATIYKDYQTIIQNGTLLIKDGKVVVVGENKKVTIPANTVIYDLKGKYIYPSLIDIYTDYGEPKKIRNKNPHLAPQFNSNNKGAFDWNQAIHPEIEASKSFKVDDKKASTLRNLGFGTVLTHQKDGIMRGTSAFVTLANSKANNVVLATKVTENLSFNKGTSTQDYPSSLMGTIALIRQTYYDVDWLFNNKNIDEYNISLKTLENNWKLPKIFETYDKYDILRADKIGDEFKIQYIFKGIGNEYQRINEIKQTNGKLILPVNFPKPYDVTDPYDALNVSLSAIKNWELAPYNLGIVAKNNIPFAITTAGLKDVKVFFKNLQKAIKNGLSTQEALKALTYNPANFINQYDKVGSLESGKLANFIITSKKLFNPKNIIYENWIKGKKYIINKYDIIDIRGKYNINIKGNIYPLTVSGELNKPTGKIVLSNKKDTTKVNLSLNNNLITLSFNPKDKFQKTIIRLSGTINFNGIIWDGNGMLADGTWVKWTAIKGKHKVAKKNKKNTVKTDSLFVPAILYPNEAYGFDSLPRPKTMLLKNATVWTNEKEGILKNTDVLIRNGKIAAVGQNLTATDAEIIDATGKQISYGIIDEHSHIAISRGVNECTQAVTAEVSIGDVINPDDINIYRQVAGGVVASQLLHGSCNPIGGQSALVKLKWGSAPDSMKIKNAPKFIKFALGENVKHANFGDFYTKRFPQTRMGVEQVYYDAFIRAKEYQNTWNAYVKLSDKEKETNPVPRIDLELAILDEVLNHQRNITCHSYVQSEINMLMHVADSMGFKINTFTHILGGYKVADKMEKHGAGASTFSDWWAYKFEVNDAIPYNGAIMHQQGITVAYNSDDAEMGRRLNQEAAKAVEYGGVSEEEALKFVTLNPAKLLHLEDRMGSIKVGKDACIVLWSGNPLSIYTKVEKTIIDGAVYFDRKLNEQRQKENIKEKARIIAKMITAKNNGEKTQSVLPKNQKLYHCDTVGE